MGKPAAISRAERARAGSDAVGKIMISKRPVLVGVNGIPNERFKTTRIKLHRCKIPPTKCVYWMPGNEKAILGRNPPQRRRRRPAAVSADLHTGKLLKQRKNYKYKVAVSYSERI